MSHDVTAQQSVQQCSSQSASDASSLGLGLAHPMVLSNQYINLQVRFRRHNPR